MSSFFILARRIVFALCCLSPAVVAAAEDAAPVLPWIGMYKEIDKENYINLTGRCLIGYSKNGPLTVVRHQNPRPDAITVKGYFSSEELKLDLKQGVLKVTHKNEVTSYQRVETYPEDLDLDREAGKRRPDKAEIENIKAELIRRFTAEQQIRQKFIQATGGRMNAETLAKPEVKQITEEMNKGDADNVAYLLQLVRNVGWIGPQFGQKAGEAAFMITLHSGHVWLMGIAKKELRRQLDSKRIQEMSYAAMTDRLRLILQQPMLYGVQGTADPNGQLVLPVIKDRQRLDANRKRVGQPPLDEYVSTMERAGQKVKILELDED